jgi:alkyl hydroperoxide reductase subunit AhpC
LRGEGGASRPTFSRPLLEHAFHEDLDMRVRTLLVVGLCLLMTTAAFGQRRSLSVGDAAPGLDIEEWVKGNEVELDKGSVYVIEFFSASSRTGMPVISWLSQIQRDYGDKNVVVIAVTTDTADVVRPWVTSKGQQIAYTVAVDRRGSTTRAWKEAANVSAVPCVFIVDRDLKIAFIGDPNPNVDGEQMGVVLRKVIRGRYDPRLERRAEPQLAAARSARQTRTWRMAERHYEEIIALKPSVFVEVALERFEMKLVDMDDREGAYRYAREQYIDDMYANDAEALAMLARRIATDPKIPGAKRDMDVAMQAARAAMELVGENDPYALATVALVHFHRGEVAEAIRLQKKAWMVAKPKEKEGYRRVLRSYQEQAARIGGGPK